jgi:hypothetical protein
MASRMGQKRIQTLDPSVRALHGSSFRTTLRGGTFPETSARVKVPTFPTKVSPPHGSTFRTTLPGGIFLEIPTRVKVPTFPTKARAPHSSAPRTTLGGGIFLETPTRLKAPTFPTKAKVTLDWMRLKEHKWLDRVWLKRVKGQLKRLAGRQKKRADHFQEWAGDDQACPRVQSMSLRKNRMITQSRESMYSTMA